MTLTTEQKKLAVEWLTGDDAARFVLARLVALDAAKANPQTIKAVRAFVYGLRAQLEEV